MNWFTVAMTTLQLLASAQYFLERKYDHGSLWLLYALANVFLMRIAK